METMYVTKNFSVRKYFSVLHALLPNIRKLIPREHVTAIYVSAWTKCVILAKRWLDPW